MGVAVQSKFLAAGALVPHARAGVGAVATQALANVAHEPRGLGLMAQGKTACEAIELLTEEDEQRAPAPGGYRCRGRGSAEEAARASEEARELRERVQDLQRQLYACAGAGRPDRGRAER